MTETKLAPATNRPWWFKWLKKHVDLGINNRDELTNTIRQAQAKNFIATDSVGMLEGVLQVENLQVRDVMIPRSLIQFVQRDDSYHDILQQVLSSKHSRYPVIDEDLEDVEGILLAKDLLKYIGREDEFDIDDVMRPVTVVPESQSLNPMLKQFRKTRNHMAIVVNEYSSVSGVITIEDVLEQIVGDIDDEHDTIDDKDLILKQEDSRFIINGLAPIEEVNEAMQCNFSSDTFDTIGGIITNLMGKIPKQGEEIKLDNHTFKILRSDGRRILRMEVISD